MKFKNQNLYVDESKLVDKIDKLTPQQKAMLPKIRNEWNKYGLNTKPANRELAEEALVESYRVANLLPPEKIYWVDSPMAGHKLHCKLRSKEGKRIVNSWVKPFYGAQELYEDNSSLCAFYDAFIRFGLRSVQKMRPLIELAKNAGWAWMFDECAIITERPIYIEQDEDNNPHSLKRMAIEYPDGWGLYKIHGFDVNERFIKHPELITANDIKSVKNKKVKLALLTLFRKSVGSQIFNESYFINL